MGVYEHFPYTNYHDVNIDWVLQTTKRLEAVADDLDKEISDEVDAQLREMIDDGTLSDIINQQLLSDINDEVDALQSDIDAITPLDAVPTDGSTKGVTSDGVYDAISAVSSDVSGLQSDIEAVKENIEVYAGKNIVCIGDSWTVGSGATVPATQRFTTLLAASLEMTELNYGVGASGFTRPNNTFLSQLETANAAMSSDEKKNTGIVLITGGVNDIRHMDETSLAAFTTAVAQCANYALTYFPYSLLVMAIGTTMNTDVYTTHKHWIYSALETLRNIHTGGRMLIIDHMGAAINGRGDTYASDDLHPNTFGHSILAGFIRNAIMGGSCDTTYYSGTYTWDDAYIYPVNSPHIFRETENILFNEGILRIEQDITGTTNVGSYSGPFGRYNMHIPFYRGNTLAGTFVVTPSGNVYVVPLSGTLSSGWEVRLSSYSTMFNTYIP